MNKELISCMPDGVKTTYEGFLRKVKTAGKRQTYCGSGLVEVCYRVGKSVISVAKGTKCLQMQFMVVKKIVTTV